MNTSEAGLKLIKQFEGLRLKSYRCPAGIWTMATAIPVPLVPRRFAKACGSRGKRPRRS